MRDRQRYLLDLAYRTLIVIIMFIFVICVAKLSGCASAEKSCDREYIYVDIETYKTWGTADLVPIGRRKIPANLRVCDNEEAQRNVTCPRHYRE